MTLPRKHDPCEKEIDELSSIKVKNFCERLERMRRKVTYWEKIFAKDN